MDRKQWLRGEISRLWAELNNHSALKDVCDQVMENCTRLIGEHQEELKHLEAEGHEEAG